MEKQDPWKLTKIEKIMGTGLDQTEMSFIDRLEIERQELDIKIDKLENFLNTLKDAEDVPEDLLEDVTKDYLAGKLSNSVEVSELQRSLLEIQFSIMVAYSNILDTRITDLKK